MKAMITFLAVAISLGVDARTLESALKDVKLAPAADISSYVTVFNRLEEMDDACDRAWRNLPDRAAYDVHRKLMHDRLMSAIGPLPEKTPLNAKTVATVQRDGYRIEKVLFESMPGLFVSANFFIPDDPKFVAPYPAVVMSCGHSDLGKDAPIYLRACVIAVKAGFAALMFDPYEQGERTEYADNCCQHHNQINHRASLIGWTMAMLRTWDGMRAVDYAMSRPEVDAAKIGYMGQSGGGTMTALMTACDLRLKATAPSGYLMSMTSLCEHMGPQDAEQNVFGQLAFGLNHTGFALIPDIPVAITCKFSDMFTYYGTRKLFRTVKTVAAKLGEADHYALNDAPGPHSWTEATEQGSVEWMKIWLKGEKNRLPLDTTRFRLADLGFDLAQADQGLSRNEIGCTPNRRTIDLPGSKSIYTILRERLAGIEKNRKTPPAGPERARLVRSLARIPAVADRKLTLKEIAREDCGACSVTHFAFLEPSGLAIPFKLVEPKTAKTEEVVVSVGRKGMAAALENAKAEADAGKAVLVADLTGLGSIGKGRWEFYGAAGVRPEEGTSAMLYLMGETMTGRRAGDLLALGDFLQRRGFTKLTLVADDDVAIAAAHAHAAEPGLFDAVRTTGRAFAWTDVFKAENDGKKILWYSDMVPNALCHYDWPELLK